MSQTKIHDAPRALAKGYRRKSFGERLGRLRVIDQIPTAELRVKAMIVEGWNDYEIAARCSISRIRVARLRNVLTDVDNMLSIVRYLEDFMADNAVISYTTDMEKAGEIVDLLSSWDSKAVSKLVEDLRSGRLAQHYAAAAEPAQTTDRSSPPDGQLYADRPDRKESAPQFIERVYGGAGWLTGDFTRADLRKVDPQAAAALNNWESHSKQRANLNLPTLKERYDRQTAPDGTLTEEAKQAIRIAERIRSATRRRLRREKNQPT